MRWLYNEGLRFVQDYLWGRQVADHYKDLEGFRVHIYYEVVDVKMSLTLRGMISRCL